MTQVKKGVSNVIFSNLGSTRGQYVFFTTQSIFNMFFSTSISLILLKQLCSVVR